MPALYYQVVRTCAYELELMALIDRQCLQTPFQGSRLFQMNKLDRSNDLRPSINLLDCWHDAPMVMAISQPLCRSPNEWAPSVQKDGWNCSR